MPDIPESRGPADAPLPAHLQRLVASLQEWARENPQHLRQENNALLRQGVLPHVTIDSESARTPQAGERVSWLGEQLRVGAHLGDRTLLFQPGRNSDYAVIFQAVTDADLVSNYDAVPITIGGHETTRYVHRGHPDHGAYVLFETPNGKSLGLDHSFVVVPTGRLQRGTPVQAPIEPDRPADRSAGAAPEQRTGQGRERTAPLATNESMQVADANSVRMSNVNDLLSGPMVQRVRNIGGTDVAVRSPSSPLLADRLRNVVIDGDTIELTRRDGQGWFYSNQRPDANIESQVKLHITGISAEDVVRLQRELLPVLEELRRSRDVSVYKTFDPNFIDPNWSNNESQFAPGASGQNSKAFTIYLPAHRAQEVARQLDRILAERGLTLQGVESVGTVGDATRNQSRSRRVSVERESWPLTHNATNEGALIDEELSLRLHNTYRRHGIDADGRLNPDVLRRIERDAGVREGQLAYDSAGKLMFTSADGSHSSNRTTYYADESRANRQPGRRTGRPALYALYELERIDPATVYTNQMESRAARPERVVPEAGRITPERTAVRDDGTIDRRQSPDATLARDQLDVRRRLLPREIEALKRQSDELARSPQEADLLRARILRGAIDALEGRLGPERERVAHQAMMEESRRRLAGGEGGGYGRAVAGGLIGVGILAAAALAYYRSSMGPAQEEPLDRARVRR